MSAPDRTADIATNVRKPGKIDIPGLCLMVVGFLSLQLFLDQGERYEWFDSNFIVMLGVMAVLAPLRLRWMVP